MKGEGPPQEIEAIRAKIDEAENDPRPSLTDAEVEQHFAERLRRSLAALDDGSA